jgi:uncharacterized protein (UPF0248 family)
MKGFARDELLKLKWSENVIDDVIVEYVSRGSPGDKARIFGTDIKHIGKSFLLTVDDTSIPFHRINKILVNGKTKWIREEQKH